VVVRSATTAKPRRWRGKGSSMRGGGEASSRRICDAIMLPARSARGAAASPDATRHERVLAYIHLAVATLQRLQLCRSDAGCGARSLARDAGPIPWAGSTAGQELGG